MINWKLTQNPYNGQNVLLSHLTIDIESFSLVQRFFFVLGALYDYLCSVSTVRIFDISPFNDLL